MERTDPQFKLRLAPELKARLEEMAEKNSRSLTSEMLIRLEVTLELDEILRETAFGGFQDAPNLIPRLISEAAEQFDKNELFRRQVRDEFSRIIEDRIGLLESRLLSLPDSSFGKAIRKKT